ncbi:MAG: DUF1499 domain-containing protein [Alphaproteobacteria bacterium]|nr:DUF1499 domain-containing protein [Alphaproteobacteria bacterium]
MLDLKTLTRPNTPNHHFLAPKGYSSAPIDGESPRFSVPPGELFTRVRKALLRQPRTTLREEAADRLSLEVRQRTALFRFPDDVTITVLPADGGSTLAIFSRSLCGRGDLGTNRRRVTAWLDAIKREAASNQP